LALNNSDKLVISLMPHTFTMKQAESMTALSIVHLELVTDDIWICAGQVEQNRFKFIYILVIQNLFVAVCT